LSINGWSVPPESIRVNEKLDFSEAQGGSKELAKNFLPTQFEYY